MTDVERILQRTLVRHADEAPRSGQLLHHLRARARRRRQRQLTALTCGLTLALCALVVGVQGSFGKPAGPSERAGQPGASLPAPSAPSPVHPALTPRPVTINEFPLKPIQPMPHMKQQATIVAAGVPTLLYASTTGDSAGMSVRVATTAPVGPSTAVGTSYRVRTHPATFVPSLATDPTKWSLCWQEMPARWLIIEGFGPVKVGDLLTYAEGIVPGHTPFAMPFGFALMPSNLIVDDASASWITFRPSNVAPGGGANAKLAVLLDERLPEAPGSRAIQVGKRAGVIYTAGGSTMLSVLQPDGRAITIQVPSNISITEAELVRFAAGIRVTSAAVAGKG
jgi:hypothetical protein